MFSRVDGHKQRKLTKEQEQLLVDKRYHGDYKSYTLDLNLHSDYFMIDEYNELLDELEEED